MNVKQKIDDRLENLKSDLENLSHDVRKGGRQMWLASLGAVAAVDEQRRELLTGRFGELVEKGEERRRRLESDARQTFEKVGSKVKDLRRGVESGASERVGRTLERLGVPTSAQISLLIDRVEQLNLKVERLARA